MTTTTISRKVTGSPVTVSWGLLDSALIERATTSYKTTGSSETASPETSSVERWGNGRVVQVHLRTADELLLATYRVRKDSRRADGVSLRLVELT